MLNRISLLLLISSVLCGCSSLSSNNVDEDNPLAYCHVSLKEQVDTLAVPTIESGESAGMVVAVLTPQGQTQVFSYGYTDDTQQLPLTGDTLFAVGSVTKGFTAETIAMLVAQQQFHWHESLGQLLPNTPLSAGAANVTIEQLASHTSGLPRQINSFTMLHQFIGYLFTGNQFYSGLDNGDFNDYLASFEPPAVPTVIYSNLGYSILDDAIQQRIGQPVEQLTQQLLLEPLGLKNTGYQPESLPGYAQRARGHAGDQPKFIARGHQVPDWQFRGYMVGAANLWSSANDLLAYAKYHLYGTHDSLIDRAFSDATTMRLRVADADSVGLGWLSNDIDGEQILYQSGFIGGFSSYIGMDKRLNTAVVVLQNSFNWNNNIGHRMLLRMAKSHDALACQTPASPSDTITARNSDDNEQPSNGR
ncbi:serine hydrolase domain-containing protein [Shewanella sp.]|uniref:serine hydrolase domain-containing protein n=1 Tax=Shewanella sp. TaxID=50422 RepID=UPI003A96E717